MGPVILQNDFAYKLQVEIFLISTGRLRKAVKYTRKAILHILMLFLYPWRRKKKLVKGVENTDLHLFFLVVIQHLEQFYGRLGSIVESGIEHKKFDQNLQGFPFDLGAFIFKTAPQYDFKAVLGYLLALKNGGALLWC